MTPEEKQKIKDSQKKAITKAREIAKKRSALPKTPDEQDLKDSLVSKAKTGAKKKLEDSGKSLDSLNLKRLDYLNDQMNKRNLDSNEVRDLRYLKNKLGK